jgi:hypothetical protein
VGTAGNIIGTPFIVTATAQLLTVPAGATGIEFGLNDIKLTDNVGNFTVAISQL